MSKVEWVYSMGRMSILTGQSEVTGQTKYFGQTVLTGYSDCTDWVG